MEKKTPLYDRHVALSGKMVAFAGYLLPVEYATGIIKEHMAVRTGCGLFDVSHMGEVTFRGADALSNVQMLVTNDLSSMKNGQARYSPMCNEVGGVVDDLLVYKKGDGDYLLVVNAANREKDVRWMRAHLFGDCVMEDISDDIAQLALQGPGAISIFEKLAGGENIPARSYRFKDRVDVGGISCLASRTGYTGEDGMELYCAAQDAPALWDKIMAEDGVVPCGLGARDTLRLEAAMPLYGHEMTDEITPLEAGLDVFVKLGKEDFIGKRALVEKGEPKLRRVGLEIVGRGIAREHCAVYAEGCAVGATTSGTFCPYLGRAVAMALISASWAEVGKTVQVDVRGRKIEARVVPLPFYKRTRA